MTSLHSTLIQYRILLYALYPLIAIITFLMAAKAKDRRYFFERLGSYRIPASSESTWFHAASVGEVNGVLPLLSAMAKRAPDSSFILTTGTPTGGAIALSKLPDNATHIYLPIDMPGAVRRFLKYARPSSAIIMETELWPNLFFYCDKNNIPLSIINARLSERTLKANAWMYRLYSETLSHVGKILARSDEDANGFMTIGATASKIKVLGNLKFAPSDISRIELLENIKRPYVLAASTHDNEEELIAKAWVEKQPEKLLVIAPRHPNRIREISNAVSKLTNKFAIRSKGEKIDSDTIIYIADTLGELPGLILGSSAVFMGGSLVPVGGHNIIEVVRYGKPVIFGPYMDNFKDETRLLLDRKIARKIQNTDELMDYLEMLWNDPGITNKISKACEKLIQEYTDVLEKYITAINEPIDKYMPHRIVD